MSERVDRLAGKQRIEKVLGLYGCLPDAPDGPVIPRFDAKVLAAAIEQEIIRAGQYGWSKITLHMDVPDAALLAQHLRRG